MFPRAPLSHGAPPPGQSFYEWLQDDEKSDSWIWTGFWKQIEIQQFKSSYSSPFVAIKVWDREPCQYHQNLPLIQFCNHWYQKQNTPRPEHVANICCEGLGCEHKFLVLAKLLLLEVHRQWIRCEYILQVYPKNRRFPNGALRLMYTTLPTKMLAPLLYEV